MRLICTCKGSRKTGICAHIIAVNSRCHRISITSELMHSARKKNSKKTKHRQAIGRHHRAHATSTSQRQRRLEVPPAPAPTRLNKGASPAPAPRPPLDGLARHGIRAGRGLGAAQPA